MARDIAQSLGDATRADCGAPAGIVAELAAVGFDGAVEVGRGGFGTVYRCRQVALDRMVAIKVLTAETDGDQASFVREQQTMAQLTGHPNIVPVLQVGETRSGNTFLVMPFCAQGCIQDRIGRLGVLDVAEVLRLGVKMAGALACAHELQVVHRDVKPSNILYTDYGAPALCDFGIARTGSGSAPGLYIGSPAYTAPEIPVGAEPSAASDVYGLGASLFSALTGHAAFEWRADGEKVIAQYVRMTEQPLPDLRERGIPEVAAAIVDVAMAPEPADRPSAKELGELIQQTQSRLGLPVDEMALPMDRGPEDAPSLVGPAPMWGSASAPSLGSAAGGKLPSPVASFVGRDGEVTQLQQLLSTSRLITLTGIGGVGKTTFARHTAATLAGQFNGVWWVELGELRDGALLTEVVAAALEVRDQIGRALTDVLIESVGQRGRTLVVLDNCEHLIGDVAKLAEVLRRDCPELHIVATSREVIDIEGETVLRLPPLPCPPLDEKHTLEALAGYEAVQLFVHRARAAAPGFALDARNATSVARIVARLEGLPLAIELAAARMRAMSAEQIADELGDRFALLARRRSASLSRRQSMAACVEWSYDLCTESEQRLWGRLSVFAESFDLPTARGVCGEDIPASTLLDLLCSLVDKSILVRVEHHGIVSFRLLETLRDYGKNRISDTERLHLARRHASWYQEVLADAETEWFGPQQLRWVQRLTREMPNLREALQTSLTDTPAIAVDMTTTLLRFWVHHAVVSEGCEWARRALEATSPEPSVQRIRALFNAAQLSLNLGDMVPAMTWVAEARNLLEVVDDPVTRGMMDFLDGYGALMMMGDADHARASMHRAMATTDDFGVQGYSTSVMGAVELVAGDTHGALAWSEKAVALSEARGDWSVRARAFGSLGAAHWRVDDLDRAEEALQRALELGLEIGDMYAVANALEILAWVAESRCQPRQAAALMAAAAEISRANGAPLFVAFLGGFHTECERRAREQLSPEEFQAAWDEGAAQTVSDVAEASRQSSLASFGRHLDKTNSTV